jgi:hypothetical protein
MVAARTLVVVGTVFAVLALLAAFIRYQALDTATVNDTAGELIADQEIRDQVAASLVDQLYANVDVAAALAQQLPPDQKGLAGAASAGLREVSDRLARRLLERPRTQQLWVNSVTTAHEQLVKVLDDDVTGITTENGAVILDLRPLVIQLGDQIAIVGRLATRLPDDTGRVEIMQADQLETAQDLTYWLKTAAAVLWIVPFVLWALALWLARGRRRRLLRMIAISTIITGLLVLVVRRVGGEYTIDALVSSSAVQPAAQDAWDILTRQLKDGGWTFVGIGLIALFAVWLAGETRSATSTRRELAPFLARSEIAFGAAAILWLLLILWAPTVQATRPQLILASAVIVAIGVEALRRITASEHPAAAEIDVGDAARAMLARVRHRRSPASGGDGAKVDELERLVRLHEQGVLTDDELALEKARVLAGGYRR